MSPLAPGTRDRLPHWWRLSALSLLMSLAACGAQSDLGVDRVGDSNSPHCEPELGRAVFEHSCQHGQLGPFLEVVAGTDEDLKLPTLNTAQHVFDIVLPQDVENERAVFYVGFTPFRNGEHAVFSGFEGLDVPLSVVQGVAAGGEAATPLHEEPVRDTTECGEMTHVDVYALERGEQYTLLIGPTSAPFTRLFFEHLPTFGRAAWEARCE